MNTITQKFYYNVTDTTRNMRLVMSSPGLERPIVWQVSKIETAQPIGVNKITLYQTEWNSDTDFIDKEAIADGDLFAYYADFYTHEGDTTPTESKNHPQEAQKETHEEVFGTHGIVVDISASSASVKIGGSYKTLTATVHNDGKDISNSYLGAAYDWKATIDGEEAPTDFITWLQGATPNIMKIKLAKIRKYIGKTLVVTCTIDNTLVGEIQFNIGAI